MAGSLRCERKHRHPVTSGNASIAPLTLAFAVVAYRLLSSNCGAFAACPPPAGTRCGLSASEASVLTGLRPRERDLDPWCRQASRAPSRRSPWGSWDHRVLWRRLLIRAPHHWAAPGMGTGHAPPNVRWLHLPIRKLPLQRGGQLDGVAWTDALCIEQESIALAQHRVSLCCLGCRGTRYGRTGAGLAPQVRRFRYMPDRSR
jgi:hypothetical protein